MDKGPELLALMQVMEGCAVGGSFTKSRMASATTGCDSPSSDFSGGGLTTSPTSGSIWSTSKTAGWERAMTLAAVLLQHETMRNARSSTRGEGGAELRARKEG